MVEGQKLGRGYAVRVLGGEGKRFLGEGQGESVGVVSESNAGE